MPFVTLIYRPNADVESCIEKLTEFLGAYTYRTESSPFDYTNYYTEEMGTGLKRIILSFKRLIHRDFIADIKVYTTSLEQEYSQDQKRTINIDPGYIAEEHLILATGKGYYHRPYLGKGVYADLTLVYQQNVFRELEWTYPDYNTPKIKKLFLDLRAKYVEELNS